MNARHRTSQDNGAELLVLFAGTAWDGNRFPDQHIAERLARWVPVLYVDPPVSIYSRGVGLRHVGLRTSQRLQVLTPRLARFTPLVVPPQSKGAMRAVTAWLVRAQAARVVKSLTRGVGWAVAATPQPVLGACGERTSVLYATDDFTAGAELMGLSEGWLRRQERGAIRKADIVIAVSDHLAQTLAQRGARSPIVIENGVDDALFANTDSSPLPTDVRLPSPIAGFIGHLSDRIDLSLLEATAATGHSLLLVGPCSPTFEIDRMNRLMALPNVQWVGPKPFEELPSYLRVMDVGLLPYTDSEFNRASFPLKVLEYLAGGRPAVASDLPAVRTLGDLVSIARGPTEFADAVTSALAAPTDPDTAERRRAVAKHRSWDAAAERFAEVLALPVTDDDC